MDSKQLAMENERLRKLLSEVTTKLDHVQASHQQVQAQHQAAIEQFVQTVELLRRFAIGVIKQDISKGSIRKKRKRAAWDDSFLLTLLASMS